MKKVRITLILTASLFCSQLSAQVGRGGSGWRYPGRYTGAEQIQALEWGTGAAAHLVRRGGFSASPEEIGRLVGQGFEATLDELLDYEAMDDSEMEAGLEAARAFTGWTIVPPRLDGLVGEGYDFFYAPRFMTSSPRLFSAR